MLKGLFGKKKGAQATEALAALPSNVAESILQAVGTRSIPAMPAAAQKAFQLAVDPNAESRDFVEVIASDEGLSSKILKIANSVYFDRGHRSNTIEESVTVIGINELRGVLNANSLNDIFPSRSPMRALLWAHDIGVGLVARQLAGHLLPSKTELAFLAGLMHDIGKLLLLQRSADTYAKVIKQIESDGLDFRSAEADAYPFDHTEVGQLIAERWNFSTELTAAIRMHHHDWGVLLSSGPSVAALVRAADAIAHALGFGHPPAFQRLRRTSEERLPEVWQALKFSAGDGKAALERARRSFETEFELYAGQSRGN